MMMINQRVLHIYGPLCVYGSFMYHLALIGLFMVKKVNVANDLMITMYHFTNDPTTRCNNIHIREMHIIACIHTLIMISNDNVQP